MNRIGITAALILCIACPCIARADDKAEIQALYDKLCKLIDSNQVDGTLALETPDFKAKGRNGQTMDGKQLASQMKMQHQMMKNSKMSIKVAKCTVKGKTADVTTAFKFSGEMVDQMGQMGPKGKTHIMGMSGGAHNVLEKTAGGWKFKSFEEAANGAMTMDGKPFNPMQGMGGPPKKK